MLDLALRNPTVHLHTHGWLLRREICNERFNESLRLGEDGEWMMRVLRGAKTVALAQVNTYCYHCGRIRRCTARQTLCANICERSRRHSQH